jgi:hypothetical protein
VGLQANVAKRRKDWVRMTLATLPVSASPHHLVEAGPQVGDLPLRTHRRTLSYMSSTLTIRASAALREALDRRAAAEDKSVSEVVRDILEAALVPRPLGERISGLRGGLRVSDSGASWRDQIRQRNWRK